MPSQQTLDAQARKQHLANMLRAIGADCASALNEEARRSLEIAALLLEQTSVARYNKAVHAFNEANGRFLRRQGEGYRPGKLEVDSFHNRPEPVD